MNPSTARPHYQFDAFCAQRELRERLADFLLDSFNVRDPELAGHLRRDWTASARQTERLFAPMLVQGAFPFPPDKTVAELQCPRLTARDPERPLHPRTVKLLTAAGIDYPLYKHQVETLQHAAAGKTVILSAGTGSGKTEAFLIPLIDRLFWDHELGLDDIQQPGIRAMIIYPLNALVNNQVERILELLRQEDDLSFAFYTSRLKENRSEAERAYRYLEREVPPDCQIIDRQSLRGLRGKKASRLGPPHILVTNFSMLEYMLIRPLDHSIFQHIEYNGRPRLRAIVLDEAHVYAGAQAAEIHMLLRRAALRFGTRLEDIQGYATSATLGGDNEGATLRKFAADIFSSLPEQVAPVIGRRYLPAEGSLLRTELGSLQVPTAATSADPLVPEDLQTVRFDEFGKPVELVRDDDAAQKAAQACVALGLAAANEVPRLIAASESRPAVLLHHVLSRHPSLVGVRRWLFDGGDSGETKHETRYLHEVVGKLFPDGGDELDEAAERATYALLQLGSLARLKATSHPYIPSRMHLFVRTPAGVWVKPKPSGATSDTWPWGPVTTQPPAHLAEDDPWLKLYLCRSCGCPLLRVWETEAVTGPSLFASPSPGAIVKMVHPGPDAPRRLPDAWGGQVVHVATTVTDHEKREPLKLLQCPHCKLEHVELEDLQLPASAALPALVDGIYPSVGEIAQKPDTPPLPGGGRRMLAFSDSRQGAARLAVEIERTHDTGVNRQLLWRALSQLSSERDDGQVSFHELHEQLVDSPSLRQRAEASPLEDAYDDDFLRNLGTVSIFEELSTPPATRGNTLESLGLVEVCYPGLRQVRVPLALRGALSEEAWHDLLATVLDYTRTRGAVKREVLRSEFSGKSESLFDLLPLPHKDRLIVLTGKQQGVQRRRSAAPGVDTSDQDRTIPLVSSHGRMLNFARRLCERHQFAVDPEGLLREVWDALNAGAESSCRRWLKKKTADARTGGDTGLQIDLKELRFKAHLAGPPFIEPITGRMHFRSVLGVSPQPDNPHLLRTPNDEERRRWASRHAVRRVREHALLGLWSVEHTAQLDVDELEDQERKFKQGKRNFMSSSTTMEMGVDLGGLTLVLLANVPPGPANYWQRGGRAGRRTDGSSLVLTLAQPRPHDQRVFSQPRDFLERAIVPPQVRLDSRALLLRHVNAFLLAEFYRAAVVPKEGGNPLRAFGRVGEFMLDAAPHTDIAAALVDQLAIDKDETLAEVFLRWIELLPAHEPVAQVVSKRLTAGTCLANEPFENLTRECAAAFMRARDRARGEDAVLKQQERRERDRGEGNYDEKFLRLLDRQRKHLSREPLLSYLVRNDFLPRFGFPIEVVRLDTTYEEHGRDDEVHPDDDGATLRMERSLELALAEYAPGSDVIAKKRVYRVAGLVPNWLAEEASRAIRRYFSECSKCHFVTFSDHVEPQQCGLCGHETESFTEFLDRNARRAGNKPDKDDVLGDGDEGDGSPPPSPVRRYLVPVGFAVKFGERPRRLVGNVERMPAPEATIGSSPTAPRELISGGLAMGFTPKSSLFTRSEGKFARLPGSQGGRYGFGYRICQKCGYALPEKDWGKDFPNEYRGHELLRGRRKCEHGDVSWDHEVLGIQQSVDAYRVRLLGDLAPDTHGLNDAETFFLSLAVCMQQAAAEMLEIDPRVLHPTVGAYRDDAGEARIEAVIYDVSGSGLLAHLDEEPLGLIRKICELLETREFAAFVQFDNQFLVEQGRLDILWLRRHLVEDPARRARLMQRSSMFEQEGAVPLRGQTPRMAAQNLIDDESQELALQAAELDVTAFEPAQVLRAVWARAVRGNQRAARVRLLIGRLPELRDDPGQLLLASRLAQLVELGVEIRRTSPARLEEDCWQLLARSARGRNALGGLSGRGDALIAWQGPAFGHAWLKDGFAIESALPAAAELAWEQFDGRWEHADKVPLDALRPRAEQRKWVLEIRRGDTAREATDIAVILQDRTGLGPLAELGDVASVTYHDRYVVRSAVAMWTLDRLLSLFRYVDGAQGVVHCLDAQDNIGSLDNSVEKLLRARVPPPNLDRTTAKKFEDWCARKSAERKLQLNFKHRQPSSIGHQRKLEVAFQRGGKVSRLVALFDHGLDWIRPDNGRDTRPWIEQTMKAEASHVVIMVEP